MIIGYDVIIVGLGPTGGTLGNLLGLNGLSVLILEKRICIIQPSKGQFTLMMKL